MQNGQFFEIPGMAEDWSSGMTEHRAGDRASGRGARRLGDAFFSIGLALAHSGRAIARDSVTIGGTASAAFM